MSELQVHEDTEVLVPLDRTQAEKLDGRIRRLAKQAGDQLVQVGRLLDEAKAGRIHEALGFASWTAYVSDSLGGTLQLSGAARQAMVEFMAGEGMSVRAIAAATGVSKSTVDRDLAQVSHDGTPAVEVVPESGVPGRDTSSQHDMEHTTRLFEEAVDALVEHQKKTTGMDGKTYTKPKRKPRPKEEPKPESIRRPPVLTVFRDTIKATGPLITQLTDLMQDARWEKTIARFNRKDRLTIDAGIAALQNLRAAMGELYNTTSTDIATRPDGLGQVGE